MISGIVTGILLLAFLGITRWAWSARTQPRFREAEQIPLRDEVTPSCRGQCGDREGQA